MSYVVSVRRDTPITSDEIRALVEDSPEFTVSDISSGGDNDSLELRWQSDKDSKHTTFVLARGAIDAFTPSDDALSQLQSLAKLLNASVVGEEGENLTDVAVATTSPQGCGALFWTAIVVGFFLFIYWLWN